MKTNFELVFHFIVVCGKSFARKKSQKTNRLSFVVVGHRKLLFPKLPTLREKKADATNNSNKLTPEQNWHSESTKNDSNLKSIKRARTQTKKNFSPLLNLF